LAAAGVAEYWTGKPMSDPGHIRNLEQIEETDENDRRMPRGVTMALVALGGACIVFAGLTLGGRTSKPDQKKADPLGDLLSLHAHAGASAPGAASAPRPDGRSPASPEPGQNLVDLSPKDVTFPQLLSDQDKPPTALAAVRAMATAPGTPSAPPAPTEPPPPTDRLPVVPVAPLPAQAVLEATPLVTRPRDAMTKVATAAAQIDGPAPGDSAPAGHEGGYQLQVSSFRAQPDAQGFADQLRARGHKAYVAEAHVTGRGTWFRVRVGPFPTQRAAAQYRTAFEAREHVVPFIVAPETTAKAH
jgi:cell division septation protein DedD